MFLFQSACVMNDNVPKLALASILSDDDPTQFSAQQVNFQQLPALETSTGSWLNKK